MDTELQGTARSAATQLFREAAISSQQTPWLGEVVLFPRSSFQVFGSGAGVLTIAILAFLIFGTYTKRTSVAGQLVPDLGLLKIYPPESGTIVEKHVRDNEYVRREQTLFVISDERRSSSLGSAQASISAQVRKRQESLKTEIYALRRLELEDARALGIKVEALRTQLATLDEAIGVQRKRWTLAVDIERRYSDLWSKGYISRDQLDAKQADRLEQMTQLDSLLRERVTTGEDISDNLAQLKQIPLKYEQQQADKRQAIDSAEQELQESEAKRQWIVSAPADGTATAVIGAVGQESEVDKPLVSIVPRGSKLVAQFYVPSRAIGFIRSGQTVELRYVAFPYEKFGHYHGTVAAVSRVALSSVELTGSNLFATSGTNVAAGQPLYRVTVTLPSQTVRALGRDVPLEAGMLVDADVLQETRRLYEWILEPLYTISGKL